jgi:N-acetyl-anhydromuramyl-L-alanine amidase AmpD
MPDDPLQLDPSIAALIPLTGQTSDTSAQAPIKFQDLSSLLPEVKKDQAQQPQQATSTQTTQGAQMPGIISMPAVASFTPGRGKNHIQGIVLHSTDGTEKSDVQTLRGLDPQHQVSANYYITRDGRIFQFVNDQDTAWHAGQTIDNSRYGNSATLGIEQEHIDGKQDWPKAQVEAAAGLVASLRAKYGLGQNQVYGHSQIAPERKQDPVNYPWGDFNQSVIARLSPAPRPAQQIAQTQASGSPTWQDLSSLFSR